MPISFISLTLTVNELTSDEKILVSAGVSWTIGVPPKARPEVSVPFAPHWRDLFMKVSPVYFIKYIAKPT